MEEITLNVGKEFSPAPYGRNGKSGDANGQKFRENYLLPKLNEYPNSIIVLDFRDVEVPPGTSFVDEVFAKLILNHSMTKDELLKRVSFIENKYFEVEPLAKKRMENIESYS